MANYKRKIVEIENEKEVTVQCYAASTSSELEEKEEIIRQLEEKYNKISEERQKAVEYASILKTEYDSAV